VATAVSDAVWQGSPRPFWWQCVRSLLVLAAVGAGVLSSKPHPAWSGLGLWLVLLVVLAILGRIPWVLGLPWGRIRDLALVVTGVASVAASFLSPGSAAIVFAVVAVVNVTYNWGLTAIAVYTVGLSLAYVIGQLAVGSIVLVVLIGPASIAGGVLMGVVRRQRAELAAEAQLAREEKAHSATLDERARIAREIHDVLAHSLAALTVQLETADALLESGRSEQAHTSVLRAGQLAREGLAETRRAIGALRGETLPLPDLLSTLAKAYETDLHASAVVEVEGQPRDLRPDVGLALYRTAQEAITNVRKHAPGAATRITLRYRPDEVALAVVNDAAPDGDRPLASTGGGYGLTGLRERAELAGGHIETGPVEGGWQVGVRIPA
jgi:signal transduction histidine kinase